MAYELKKGTKVYDMVMKIDEIINESDDWLEIPPQWIRRIKFKNGKPHIIAPSILSYIKKNSKGYVLKITYNKLEDCFHVTKKQIKLALEKLEDMGLITRTFSVANDMFIILDSKRIEELTYSENFEPYPLARTIPESQDIQIEEEFVYIAHAKGLSHPYKIGASTNPDKRIKGFTTVTMPFDIEIIKIIPCNNMLEAESVLHEKFSNKKGKGEWFDLDEYDLYYLSHIFSYNGEFSGEVCSSLEVITSKPSLTARLTRLANRAMGADVHHRIASDKLVKKGDDYEWAGGEWGCNFGKLRDDLAKIIFLDQWNLNMKAKRDIEWEFTKRGVIMGIMDLPEDTLESLHLYVSKKERDNNFVVPT